jgi:hypothetical protein
LLALIFWKSPPDFNFSAIVQSFLRSCRVARGKNEAAGEVIKSCPPAFHRFLEKRGKPAAGDGWLTNKKGFLFDEKGWSKREKGFMINEKGFSNDEKGLSGREKGFLFDEEGFSFNDKGWSEDQKGWSGREKGFLNDKKGWSEPEIPAAATGKIRNCPKSGRTLAENGTIGSNRRQRSATRSRTLTFSALAIRIKASIEIVFTPRSTALI